jgi:transcriptional regulator of nitric oxide reductase
MQSTKGIHHIATQTGKPLYACVLKSEEGALLLDTGMAHTPGETILPYFAKVGIDPAPRRLDGRLVDHLEHGSCGVLGVYRRPDVECTCVHDDLLVASRVVNIVGP